MDGQSFGVNYAAALHNDRAITKEPTGFTNSDLITVAYSEVTNKITLTGTFEAYWRGVKVPELISGWSSPAIEGTDTKFLYYDGSDFTWAENHCCYENLYIALVRFDSAGDFQFAVRECHGFMPHDSHLALHYAVGTRLFSGGDLSGYTLASTTAANRRFALNETVLLDEDLYSTLPELAKAAGAYTQRYLDGVTADVVFDKDNDDIVPLNGAIPRWNQYTGGAWQLTDMSNNSYMAVYVFALPTTSDANSQKARFQFVTGQHNGTLLSIQQRSVLDLNLSLTTGASAEFVAIGKIIIHFIAADWQIYSVEKLTGSRALQAGVAAGYLTTVNGDDSLRGLGTGASPLAVNCDSETITAGDELSPGNIAYFKVSDGKYYLAKADAYATCGTKLLYIDTLIAAAGTGIGWKRKKVSGTFTQGEQYLSASTAGEYTSTAPSLPNYIINLGNATTTEWDFNSPQTVVGG